jgi:hypothetical protein
VRHDQEWGMVYSPHAPYEVLQTKTMDFDTIQRMRRFARYWDLVANSGNFVRTTPLLWAKAESPFAAFMRFSEWLYQRMGRSHAISLNHLGEAIFEYLGSPGIDRESLVAAMAQDLARGARTEIPEFLRPFMTSSSTPSRPKRSSLPRQARHLA